MMNSLILSSGVPAEGSDTKSSTDLSCGGRWRDGHQQLNYNTRIPPVPLIRGQPPYKGQIAGLGCFTTTH